MKRKLWLRIGVATIVGAVFWMRALASWRPVTVANFKFQPAQLRFSRDGRKLLVQNDERTFRAILDVETGEADYDLRHIRTFDKNHSSGTFPRTWFDNGKKHFLFAPSPGRTIELLMSIRNEADLMMFEEGRVKTAWSKERREVYGEWSGEICIWDWNSGKLKRRVRYSKNDSNESTFSPDGKWLVATTQRDRLGTSFLRRYEVQTGEMIEQIANYPGYNQLLFSPDGHFFCFALGSGTGTVGVYEFKVMDVFTSRMINQWRVVDGGVQKGPVKWVSAHEIGVVTHKDFEWRDAASGKLLRSLPGPNGANDAILDWALSPNGNYIYAAEQSGTIRRWRAR